MIKNEKADKSTAKVKIIPTSCSDDCGGRCLLRAHVKDGVILRIETDNDNIEPQLKACAKGRAYRQRVYAPDRLKYPLKRVGERGEGKFKRISWDEALDTVASELKRIKETYGPSAIFADGNMGNFGHLHFLRTTLIRLLFMFGGCSLRFGSLSNEAGHWASDVTYGTQVSGNMWEDLLNSRLIIMWGWNPAETVFSTGTAFTLTKVKEAGTKIICVDPRFSNTAATYARQWIPIRPCTDTAMMIAMAYVIITENLQDQKFLDTYTIGFDKFKDYVLGAEDGIPKTPAWAEAITGVPATTIENLAREYATSKPAALIASWAAGRTAGGEQYHRTASTLAAMTGNIGIHGGYAAGMQTTPMGFITTPPPWPPSQSPTSQPVSVNPAEIADGREPSPPSFDAAVRSRYKVHNSKIADAILKGKAGGYPIDIKMAYLAISNLVNQRPNINKTIEALKKLEFIVVHDMFMTPTAKFADILLPVAFSVERNDIVQSTAPAAYVIYANKAAKPLAECKTDFEICRELAARLGIEHFNDYGEATDEQLVRESFKCDKPLVKEIPDYDEFKKQGFHKIHVSEPAIAFKKQIEDPANNPFPTPSGKIEIYSQRLADLNNPKIPPIPKYIEPWEGPDDPLTARYPLQLITAHPKVRSHSTMDNIPWLRALEPQVIWMNSADALAREITNGDAVKIFNDRGQVIIPVKVTERIMPGVVNMNEGAWYTPDKNGIDRGGCPNVLTRDEHSPGGAFSCNSSLVQVEKVQAGK